MLGKASYLKKLTSKMQFRSVEVGEKMEGSSPPSVFIGNFGYPKVYVGPMITPEFGDTSFLDFPEAWIPTNRTPEDIVQFRLQLVRGKETVGIKDLNNTLVQKLQEISLSDKSIVADAEFKTKPRGVTFNDDHQPFGPSAQLKEFNIENTKWEQHLEKVYYDTDHKSSGAMVDLYRDGLTFTQIQKALSVGTMGIGKNRRLVPTRWSITATDDTLGKHLLADVRYSEILETYEVYEFETLRNKFVILFTPTPWQYEFMEAFIHVVGNEEVIFSDWEPFQGRTTYSEVGGCYYAVRFASAEKLSFRKKQAGVIVFRESYQGYIPLGVFTCRETARHALAQKPLEFSDMKSALAHISTRVKLPLKRFMESGSLLAEVSRRRQMLLSAYDR